MGDEENVRAFLFPVTDSAKHSLQHSYNSGVVQYLQANEQVAYPPSPLSEAGLSELLQAPSNHVSAPVYAVLKQSKDLYCFTFGSATDNFLVLQDSPLTSPEDGCYLNLVHCRIYPDPDSERMWFENPSTSTQRAWKVHFKQDIQITDAAVLQPKEYCALDIGDWFIELGKGVSFLLFIVEDTDQFNHTPILERIAISPQEFLKKVQSKAREKPHAIQSVAVFPSVEQKGHQCLQVCSHEDESVGISKIANPKKSLTASRKDGAPQDAFATSKHVQDNLDVGAQGALIGQTEHSTVTTTLWKGTTALLKKCRTPSIPRAADNWRHEVDMLKLVKGHENVASILDCSAEQLSITLRDESGQSLEQFVKSAATGKVSMLSADDCDQIWKQISDALDYVHSKDVLHLDVKPQNIVWSPKRRKACLIDFGLACRAIPGTFRTAGTPCYVAPEYLRRMMSGKSDIWALGIVIAFAYGYMPLPKKSWVLANVWQDDTEQRKMLHWIEYVAKLRHSFLLSRPLLAQMLELNPERRIASHTLANSLPNNQEQLLIQIT